jgi:hypothetical protein
MIEVLIILRDTALLVVICTLVLLFLSLLGAISQSKSFLATIPVILLGPILPALSRLGMNVLDWYSPGMQEQGASSAGRFRTFRGALDYLANRIADEAKLQGTPLSETERKMLYFSETDPTLADMAAVCAEFDRNCNEKAYEEKIAHLIRRIEARDQRQDHAARAAWDDAVLKLSQGDYYLLVLLGSQPAESGNVRPHHDILRLWITAFGIVLGLLGLIAIRNWLFGQGFFLHWLHGR